MILEPGKLYILSLENILTDFNKVDEVYLLKSGWFMFKTFLGLETGISYKFIIDEPFLVLEYVDWIAIANPDRKYYKIIQNNNNQCNMGYVHFYLEDPNTFLYTKYNIFEKTS